MTMLAGSLDRFDRESRMDPRRIDPRPARSPIPEVAPAPRPATLPPLIHALRQWLTRRAAIRELDRLDDELLRDIGLERKAIPLAVDAMLNRGSGRSNRS